MLLALILPESVLQLDFSFLCVDQSETELLQRAVILKSDIPLLNVSEISVFMPF